MPASARNRSARPDDGHPWLGLGYYNAYRQLLALLMVAVSTIVTDPRLFGEQHPQLFAFTSIALLVAAVSARMMIGARRPAFTAQVILHLAIDIAALTTLMHASGGVSSGLGMLLMVTVGAGGLLLVGDLAILFAALASLALLGEQVYAQLYNMADGNYTQAGILGALFFATAITAQWISRRLKESEALAEQRGIDLANLEQLNDYVIDRLQSGIVVVDAQRRIRLLNQAAAIMLDHENEVFDDRLDGISAPLTERLAAWQENPATDIPPMQTADGATEVLCRFARLDNDSGVMIFLDDSSTQERQLQQMKQATLARLTGSIAHEIRNPLSAIHHAAQLLGEDGIDPDGRSRMTDIISVHVKRVDNIISSILQLSRHNRSERAPIQLNDWMEAFAGEFCSLHDLDPSRLRLELEPDGLTIEFDAGQLRQILDNLCENALRYGKLDGSECDLTIRGGRQAGVRGIFIDVIDSGPGIDPEQARHIFEPFYTTNSRGSGLGLYIARALCEHNYARLDHLQPASGQRGSIFRLRFAALPIA